MEPRGLDYLIKEQMLASYVAFRVLIQNQYNSRKTFIPQQKRSIHRQDDPKSWFAPKNQSAWPTPSFGHPSKHSRATRLSLQESVVAVEPSAASAVSIRDHGGSGWLHKRKSHQEPSAPFTEVFHFTKPAARHKTNTCGVPSQHIVSIHVHLEHQPRKSVHPLEILKKY